MDSFKKCDLHMHSSSCYSRNYSKEDFIKKLKIADLDVVSITDHNVVDVDLYREVKMNIPGLVMIGGIELNIALDQDHIEKHSLYIKDNYFHAIILFSYDSLDLFWDKLKEILLKEGVDVSTSDIRKISKDTEGKFFYLNKVQEAFKDIDYYLVFHEGKSDRNLSDYLPNKKDGNDYQPNIKFKHNLFYYNNKYAIEGGMKTKRISNYFETQLNLLLSRFLFSDAKKLTEIGSKFSWINFDGRFESLMLPLSDPETRIITSDVTLKNPQSNLDSYLAEIKITMRNPVSNENYEVNIEFSPSYNGIIGSRGSGKSLLGSTIANKDVDKYKEYIDHSKTLYRIKGKSFQNNPPKCKYLSQSSLLDIYSNGDIKNIDFIKEYCKTMEQDSNAKINAYIVKTKKLLNLEKKIFMNIIDTNEHVLKDVSFIEASVNEDYMIPTSEISQFIEGKSIRKNLSVKNEEVLNTLNDVKNTINEIQSPDKYYTELVELSNAIEEFKVGISSHIDVLITFINDFEEKLGNLNLESSQLRKVLIDKLLLMINNENINYDKTAKNFIDDKTNAINQLNNLTLARAKMQYLYDCGTSLTNDVKKESKSSDIVVNEFDKLVLSTTIEDANDFKTYFSEQFKSLNYVNHNDLMINLILTYNEIDKFSENFNGLKFKRSSIRESKQYIDKLFTNITTNIGNVSLFSIRLYFNDKELDKYSPGKKSEILLDIFLDKSILNENYSYIILDQPEDNMDTKTITKKLIMKIRELKKDIQFFVISHSAAVIINGDAENLIYANEIDNSLTYEFGRIIDDKMKKNIVETLDGGEKNLKMRLNKYDFKMEENYND